MNLGGEGGNSNSGVVLVSTVKPLTVDTSEIRTSSI